MKIYSANHFLSGTAVTPRSRLKSQFESTTSNDPTYSQNLKTQIKYKNDATGRTQVVIKSPVSRNFTRLYKELGSKVRVTGKQTNNSMSRGDNEDTLEEPNNDKVNSSQSSFLPRLTTYSQGEVKISDNPTETKNQFNLIIKNNQLEKQKSAAEQKDADVEEALINVMKAAERMQKSSQSS